jgi:hypothetical protein
MGSKTAADTDSGKFTKAQAEENGWVIYHQQDPKAVTARGTGGNIEVLVSAKASGWRRRPSTTI